MIINYEYKGRVWDDIQFIVGRNKGRIYLLTFPNPTRAFSMTDPELRTTSEAKTWLEIKKPEFKKDLEEVCEKIIDFAKEKKLDKFGQYLVYRGNDESRKWKSQVNMNDSGQRYQADEFMQRVSKVLVECVKYKSGDVKTERESEGLWIILPYNCGNQIVSFAFLRINDKLLLGDIGVDQKIQ